MPTNEKHLLEQEIWFASSLGLSKIEKGTLPDGPLCLRQLYWLLQDQLQLILHVSK